MGRLLSCALPTSPTDQPSLSFTVPTHCKTDEMSTGRGGAVEIPALPWTAHVCSQQASALPWRKELSGEELARDWSAPPCILTANTDTTCRVVPIKSITRTRIFCFLPPWMPEINYFLFFLKMTENRGVLFHNKTYKKFTNENHFRLQRFPHNQARILLLSRTTFRLNVVP